MRQPFSRRGNLATITAVATIPLMIAVGLAVDYTRASAVRSELQRAVDAASLAGARVLVSYPLNASTVEADARRYFFANYHDGLADASLINGGPTVTIVAPGNDRVDVGAAADVPMVFGRLIGFNKLRVSVSALTERYSRGMELVLALDTTNSMSSSSRLTNLKSGANDLLDIVFGASNNERSKQVCPPGGGNLGGGGANSGNSGNGNSGGGSNACPTQYTLLVGIVPFVATVNVMPDRGRSASAMPTIVDPTKISAITWSPTYWKGCVKARPYPFEEASADATPTTSAFDPYRWPPSAATVVWGGVTYTGPNVYTATSTSETWMNTGGNAANRTINRERVGWGAGNQAGPNKGCGFPILPLQPYKNMAKQHISALAVGATNGTAVSVGFAWGWRLLSPSWRSWWAGGTWNAFNGNALTSTFTPTGAPVDYGTLVDKVLVLFTDGQNEMGDGTANSVQSCCSNAYGDWSARPLGSTPVTELNARTVEVCNAIKARGIKIFVVLLYANPPASVLNTFNQNGCASGPTYFYQTADPTALRTVFREIGSALSNLRLVR
ncbi:MAG: Tad domain-containing protein [Alphaproteobacteria bacterium]|nr:Tad domain-containing protein [Alphaproteobacteria bacterium]